MPVDSAWRRPRGARDGGAVQHVQASIHTDAFWVTPISGTSIGRVADGPFAIAHRQPTRSAMDKHDACKVPGVCCLTQALPGINPSPWPCRSSRSICRIMAYVLNLLYLLLK